MAKPGRREDKPSTELRCFTDRDDQRNPVRLYLNREVEPPVVMFYGVGGAGKTSLLKRLREELPGDVPSAYLDFDPQMAGQRCAQLGRETPRFDLAFAMLRHKRGGGDEPGMRGHGPLGVAGEIAAEVAQAAQHLPGVNVVLNQARKALGKRLKNTALERLLASAMGSQFVLKLRTMTAQEIGDQLLPYLADDLREAIPPHLNRAVRGVLSLDTFEAVSAGLSNEEQRRIREHWIRELPATLDFALVVLAGQNRLDWDEAEPD